ncbi:hypothetical protein BGX27_000662 [Mortierella sp. AM989]|nr:hypothetical protein BGX27_000662 [Mortierella sp. AM989]
MTSSTLSSLLSSPSTLTGGSSSSSSSGVNIISVPYRSKQQRRTLFVSLLSAVTLTLAFIGNPSFHDSVGTAMALPVASMRRQEVLMAPPSYMIRYDQSTTQQELVQESLPDSQDHYSSHLHSSKHDDHQHKKKHQQQQQQQHGDNKHNKVFVSSSTKVKQDIYQDRYLDLASRVSGKNRKQVKMIVDRENIENDSKEKWLKVYEEQDAREKRRIAAQEMKDEYFGMFAHYLGRQQRPRQQQQQQQRQRQGRDNNGHNSQMGFGHGLARGTIRFEQVQNVKDVEKEEVGDDKEEKKKKEGGDNVEGAEDDVEEKHTTVVNYAWVPDNEQGLDQDRDQDSTDDKKAHKIMGPVGYKKVAKSTPTIFYVPHQDDDALAMALSIREHIESGRRVIVHLYSDGINPLLRDIVAGDVPCTLHHMPIHRQNLTLQDVVTGRTHEFRNSLRALGVKDEDVFETGWSDVEPYLNYDAFKEKLRDLIVGYEDKYPGASHKCISGEYDTDATGRNPTHRACWDVATTLVDDNPGGWPSSNQLWDFRFYRTYTFYNPKHSRTAQYIRSLPQYLHYKQRALDQYKRWDPESGELAWGYHSVKPLIDASYHDPLLYIDMLDNDPIKPQNWRRKVHRDHHRDESQRPEMEKLDILKGSGGTNSITKSSSLSGHDHGDSLGQSLIETLVSESSSSVNNNVGGDGNGNARVGFSKGNKGWSERELQAQKEFLRSFQEAVKRPEGRGYSNKQDGNNNPTDLKSAASAGTTATTAAASRTAPHENTREPGLLLNL